MLLERDITNLFSFKPFICESYSSDDQGNITMEFESHQDTSSLSCPICNGKVHIHGTYISTLKDMPSLSDGTQKIKVLAHRYKCQSCSSTFNEDVVFKYPGTRVTKRAAVWIKVLLLCKMSIKSVSILTGIHWETISKIHKDYVYATCVMDIDEGDVIWVGKGRSIADFSKFFEETDHEYLSEVQAVAMDMNASYNKLVEKHLAHVAVVYDRYHMQAQFGKDVLEAVRLEEAKRHKAEAEELKANISHGVGKEEMTRLFEIRDPKAVERGWCAWFEAAKARGIPQFERFARIKGKRLPGLISHATHPISTGKLEGFNNKIKVSKRIGYGYRNDEYFFTLIRYSSIPYNRIAKENVLALNV